MNHTIPNLIKQPSQCCINCGKSYKKRENLTKHLVVCDLLNISKRKSKSCNIIDEEDEEIIIPSNRKMYQMLIELGCKYNKLEEQMNEMSKWVSKKKKKINVIDWLNTNIIPNTNFETFINSILFTIENTDIEFIMENSFYNTMQNIFYRVLVSCDNNDNIPIIAFTQKINAIYIFQNENTKWIEISKEDLIKWFNKMHMKLTNAFYVWKKIEINNTISKDNFENNCDKTLLKLMNIDFRAENTFSKLRSVLFQCIKKDMKSLVEYEFEF